jgi:hypothetical protein
MSSALPQKTPREKTRIARLFAPAGLKNSTLLPGDRWILKNAADILKTDRELRKNLGRIGIFSALAVITAGAGIAGMAVAGPLLAAGIGVAALTGALVFGKKLHACWKNFKTAVLPKIRAEMTVRYINMKGPQLVDKWKKHIAQNQQQKQATEKPAAAGEKTDKKISLRSFFAKLSARAPKEKPKAPPPVNNAPDAGKPPKP